MRDGEGISGNSWSSNREGGREGGRLPHLGNPQYEWGDKVVTSHQGCRDFWAYLLFQAEQENEEGVVCPGVAEMGSLPTPSPLFQAHSP